MGIHLIENCLHYLSHSGIDVDKQLVQMASKKTLESGNKLLILLLDGQKYTWRPGRLACLELNPELQVLSLTVFEQFDNFSVRVLSKY